MAELKLDIVFNNLRQITKKLENIKIGTVAEGGGNMREAQQNQERQTRGIGALVFLAGAAFGLLAGIFGSIESVNVLLTAIGGLINQLVAPFVPFLITVLKPITLLLGLFLGLALKFFKDPVKSLIRLAVFIVNGILAGVEVLINTIRGVFGLGRIELPRFQELLVIEAFNRLEETTRKQLDEGTFTVKNSFEAQRKFLDDLGNSFVKNSTFAKIATEGVEGGLERTFILGTILDKGSTETANLFTTVFDNVARFGTAINQKIEQAERALGITTGRRFRQTFAQPVTNASGILPLLAETRQEGFRRIASGGGNNVVNVNVEGNVESENTIQRIAQRVWGAQRQNLTRRGTF